MGGVISIVALEIFFPTKSLRNLNYTKSNKYVTSYIDKNTHTHTYKYIKFYNFIF